MSVKLLESIDPEQRDLLYFLGCLPGGVRESQLKKMWDRQMHSRALENLNQLALLEAQERGSDRLLLTPHMINYIEGNIDEQSKNHNMKIICQF